MNSRKVATALVALMIVFAGCGPSPSGIPLLESTQWTLVALEGDRPLTGTALSAEFSADQISGSTGCNHYFATYEALDGSITFSGITSTEMGCTDPEGVMDQEQAFLTALSSVASYRLAEAQLELLDAADAVVLTYGPLDLGVSQNQ